MDQPTPQTIRLQDYQPPRYAIDHTDLRFELGEEATLVTSTLKIRRIGEPGPLVLDGEDLELVSVSVDGRALEDNDFQKGLTNLTFDPGVAATVEIVTRIKPQDNTQLSGLYKSSGVFCTQCEAEGFRRITYYMDRPDVLSVFRATIVGDKAKYPVLLSNGNLVASRDGEGGQHIAVWEDPFPKPCYLFALVAGDLAVIEDKFTTMSGRDVDLRIYTIPEDQTKCTHAMESLIKSMRWDEETYGLEYDLEVYNIVAVRDFNMGAMENKSLNVFNTAYVLATPETATDMNFAGIESVIAHEYFHNWTGNRVTCRDWFQLSLKEGLTVFRDQQFSADMQSAAVQRIEDVRALRARQFPEDAGPLAHPVRPESYIEINNFYTSTVYEKGAEVIRMMHTLLGAENFRKGMDLYFERHDGTAATVEDFAGAMQDASGIDLTHFRRWYSQAGTPHLEVRGEHDANAGTYALTVRQKTKPTPGQPQKDPLHIPLALGLLDPQGEQLPLTLQGENQGPESRVLSVTEAEQTFTFTGVTEKPVPSLLRGFSAPVTLDAGYTRDELAFLSGNDPDPFARWEAGQTLATQVMLDLVDDHAAGRTLNLDEGFVQAIAATLEDSALDQAFVALAITLPSQAYLAQQMKVIDVDGIEAAHDFVRTTLSDRLHEKFAAIYQVLNIPESYRFDAESVGRRSLKNACLSYLMQRPAPEQVMLVVDQFRTADNMTDSVAALSILANTEVPQRDEALAEFYERWSGDPLVVDKWLGVQAMSILPDTLERVRTLMGHEAFSLRNPNKVRALIGSFSHGNQPRFNDSDGGGYALLADVVLELDGANPQVAARLMGAFNQWRRFDKNRQALMRDQIERVVSEQDLSKDVYEIASKALADL
ncbi:MAG: aminopeptidase N [Alphaproteobacteria bacterium]